MKWRSGLSLVALTTVLAGCSTDYTSVSNNASARTVSARDSTDPVVRAGSRDGIRDVDASSENAMDVSYGRQLDLVRENIPGVVDLWQSVFRTSNDSVLIFSEEDTETFDRGDVVGVLPKDKEWTPGVLQSSLHDSLDARVQDIIGVGYPDNAQALEDTLASHLDVTYNSGRKKSLAFDEYGDLIDVYQSIYARHGLPERAATQLFTESGGDPLAQSYYALGIGQLHEQHYREIRREIDGVPHWADPIGMANIAGALMRVESKLTHGFTLPAFSFYHSGITNYKRIVESGSTGDGSLLEQYVNGLETLHEASESVCVDRFGGTAGTATMHYPAIITALTPIVEEVADTTEQASLHRVVADRYWSDEGLSEVTGLSEDAVVRLNPHLRFGRMHLLTLPDSVSVSGRERTFWKQESTELDSIWRAYEPSGLNTATADSLQSFSSLFEREGRYAMASATHIAAQAIDMRESYIAERGVRPGVALRECFADANIYKDGSSLTR